MADKLYKYTIDVPATLNKSKSLSLALDPKLGSSFRLQDMWVAFSPLDAIAEGDDVGFQISTKSRNEETTFLDIADEYEIFTWDRVLSPLTTEGNATIMEKPNIEMHVPEVEGTFLDCSITNYITQLVTGQAGATNKMHIKILGGYTRKDKDEWNFNKF